MKTGKLQLSTERSLPNKGEDIPENSQHETSSKKTEISFKGHTLKSKDMQIAVVDSPIQNGYK